MTPTETTPPALVRRVLVALATAAAIVLAATTSAAAADDPILVAPGGCSFQCIEKALVTTTTTTALVEVVTAVPTRVVLTARRYSSTGQIDGPAITVEGPLLRTSRTLSFRGLDPERTYWISVKATDAAGVTASRYGKFTTRSSETAIEPGPGAFSPGSGCTTKCITKAVPVHVGPTAALFEVETNASARITVIASLAGTGSIVSKSTSAFTTSYRHLASPLSPGTRYDLVIRATDVEGRTEQHQFTFKTVERKARVTFWKIQVIDDGDRGVDRGELSFDYWVGGKMLDDGRTFEKRSSGDVFNVVPRGTSRQGLAGVVSANGGSPKLDIRVHARECDGHTYMSFCVPLEVTQSAPSGGGTDGENEYATAGGPFALNQFLGRGALPGNYGSMLPSGHHAYLVFETTQYHVKFRVYAYVDFFYGS